MSLDSALGWLTSRHLGMGLVAVVVILMLSSFATPESEPQAFVMTGLWVVIAVMVAQDVEDLRISNRVVVWLASLTLAGAATADPEQQTLMLIAGAMTVVPAVLLWLLGGLGGGDVKTFPFIVSLIPFAFPGTWSASVFFMSIAAMLTSLSLAALITSSGRPLRELRIPVAPAMFVGLLGAGIAVP